MRQRKLIGLAAVAVTAGMLAAIGWDAWGAGPARSAMKTPGAKLDPARRAKAAEYVALARKAMTSHSSLMDIGLEDIAEVEAKSGDLAGAKKTARGIESGWNKLEALAAIARAQAAAGDLDGARKTLDGAEQFSESVPLATMATSAPSEDPENVLRIGVARAQIGDIAGAKKLATGLGRRAESAEILAYVAQWQARHGDMAGARASFAAAAAAWQPSEGVWGSLFTLPVLAQMQLDSGDRAGAEKTLRLVTDTNDEAVGLAALAANSLKEGDKAAAKALLEKAHSVLSNAGPERARVWQRSRAWVAVGKVMAKSGDTEAAKKCFDQAALASDAMGRSAERSVFWLAQLAMAQSAAGDAAGGKTRMAAALEAMRKLPMANGARVHAMWSMAGVEAGAGDGNAAREMVAEAMKTGEIDPTEIALQLRSVAAGIARAEGVDADLAWVAKMPTTDERALAYAAAAAAMVDAEEK